MRRLRVETPTLILMGLAAGSGVTCLWLKGAPAFFDAIVASGFRLVTIMPLVAAGLLIGGFVQQLLPKELASKNLGSGSGFRGLILASFLGMMAPGGPMISFPLVHALWIAGADVGAVVSFLMSWSLIGVHRLFVWELPFMGGEFTILRFVVSLPLPILSGILVRVIVKRVGLTLKADAP